MLPLPRLFHFQIYIFMKCATMIAIPFVNFVKSLTMESVSNILLHIVDKSLTCFPEYLTADRIMKLLSPENPSIPHCCVLFDNKQGDHSDWNLVKEFLSGTHIK